MPWNFAQQVNEFGAAQCVNCNRIWRENENKNENTKVPVTTKYKIEKKTYAHNWKWFQCVVREINGIDPHNREKNSRKKHEIIRNLNSIQNLQIRFFFIRASACFIFRFSFTPSLFFFVSWCVCVCVFVFDKIRALIYYLKKMIGEWIWLKKNDRSNECVDNDGKHWLRINVIDIFLLWCYCTVCTVHWTL